MSLILHELVTNAWKYGAFSGGRRPRTPELAYIGRAGQNGPSRRLARGKRSAPDGAILDINLAGEWVTPVAETLKAMSVPFILTSGYVAADLQAHPVLRDAVNVGKSWRTEYLLRTLRSALEGR